MIAQPQSTCDVVVIGAGIVGLAAARELTRRNDDAQVTVLEREPSIAAHQTSHSSKVIHAGVYYEPGTLKARLCVTGAGELYEYCAAHGIEARCNGKLIVATSENELGRLDELERRATANGVPGLRRVDGAEIKEIEPAAAGIAGLHSPNTGVVDFAAVARAFADEVEAAGGHVITGCGVASVEPDGEAVLVRHAGGVTHARAVVACAGAWADRLARNAGAPASPRIVPFRGAYLRLRPERDHLVRANIYPVPDPDLPFLGAHLTRGPDGSVLLGPTALLVATRRSLAWPGTWRVMARHWRAGALELYHATSKRALVRSARRLVPELRPADFTTGFSGTRAQAVGADGTLIDDFVVSRVGSAVFVRNAPSPAATSALPLARLIADEANDLLG